MDFLKKPYIWAAIYATLLVLFTLYAALDTFVISQAYVVLGSDGAKTGLTPTATAGASRGQSLSGTIVVTDNSYSDENTRIAIKEYREHDTDIFVADVRVSSAGHLRTAFARKAYGKNITQATSEIAGQNSAILAINGDYYGAQRKGYVIRNGAIYRDTVANPDREDLAIFADGSFGIITEGSVTAAELISKGATQALSFGPSLLIKGEVTVTENREVAKAMASNPRTAIGIIDTLHYVMVVSDGRTSENAGLTLYQLALFMKGLGVVTAYNLDGGGSSTMYFNGKVLNHPTTFGNSFQERGVSDIVYFG